MVVNHIDEDGPDRRYRIRRGDREGHRSDRNRRHIHHSAERRGRVGEVLTGRDHLSAGIDFTCSYSIPQIANSSDAIVLNGTVPGLSSPAGTIDNLAVTNDDVVFGSGSIH